MTTLSVDQLVSAFRSATTEYERARDEVEIQGARRREVVVQLVESGLSYRKIAELLGTSTPRIGQIAKGGRA